MAEITLNKVFAVNTHDLSCYLRSVEIASDTDMHDSTTLCTNGNRTFRPGLTERTVTAEGFLKKDDPTADPIDDLFDEMLNGSDDGDSYIATIADGSAVGSPATLLRLEAANYNIQETVGELIIVNFEGKASKDASYAGGKAGGRLLMHQTVTGIVDGTTFDAGATAFDAYLGDGYTGHIHVTGGTYTSITVQIQHSANGSSWTDIATKNATPGGYAYSQHQTGATLNRYRRAIVSAFVGTDANVTVSLVRGF